MMSVVARWVMVMSAVMLMVITDSHARTEHDFEFDDNNEVTDVRRARRYMFNNNKSLCRALRCGARERCVVRDETAVCVARASRLDDDVWYEAGAGAVRCAACGAAAGRARFVCGSDNRTYSSLCRLDLHNCMSRPAPAVRPACRGVCPCASRRTHTHTHTHCALDNMADRLLDWFSVLMEDDVTAERPPSHGFPSDCKPEVRWMFTHLDVGGDGVLSRSDLYMLRHDERERCLRPFLARCGGGGGVTRDRWCSCFARASRPCAALSRAVTSRGVGRGSWSPTCDARGYYTPLQCHTALGVCWCVDAHGVELPNTRTKGTTTCPTTTTTVEEEVREAEAGAEAEAEAGAPADDEDGAGGSGDNELRY